MNTQVLKKLKLSQINLSDVNVFKHITAYVEDTTTQSQMQHLDLSQCSFKSSQLVILSTYLANNRSIVNLNLSQNNLLDRDKETIVMVPPKNPKSKKLPTKKKMM